MRAALLVIAFVALGCGSGGGIPLKPVQDARAALAERGPVLDKGAAALDDAATAEHELRELLLLVCPAEPVALTPAQCDRATAAFNKLRDGTATLQGVGAHLQALLDQADAVFALAEAIASARAP